MPAAMGASYGFVARSGEYAASGEAGGVGDVDVTGSDGVWVGGRRIGRTCGWTWNTEKIAIITVVRDILFENFESSFGLYLELDIISGCKGHEVSCLV